MTTYTLTRENTETGVTISWEGLTLREVGQCVAFCAVDNCRLDRGSASKHGMLAEQAAKRGQVFGLNQYEFRAVPE